MKQFEENNPNKIVVPNTYNLITINQNKLDLFKEYLEKIVTFFDETGLKRV